MEGQKHMLQLCTLVLWVISYYVQGEVSSQKSSLLEPLLAKVYSKYLFSPTLHKETSSDACVSLSCYGLTGDDLTACTMACYTIHRKKRRDAEDVEEVQREWGKEEPEQRDDADDSLPGNKKWVDHTNYGSNWGTVSFGKKMKEDRKRWIDNTNFGKRWNDQPLQGAEPQKKWIDNTHFAGKRWIDSSNFGKRWIDSSHFGKRWIDTSNFGKRWIDSSHFGKRWIDTSNFGKRWIDTSNFGKRWIDSSNFGKKKASGPGNPDSESFGKPDMSKKWIDSSNFGKRLPQVSRLEKKWIDSANFGKRLPDVSKIEKKWIDSANFGKRHLGDLKSVKKWIDSSQFGKRWIDNSNFGKRWIDNSNFGKRWIDNSNFGKRSSDISGFGKRWIDSEQFGKKSDGASSNEAADVEKNDENGLNVEDLLPVGESAESNWSDSPHKHPHKRWVDVMNFGKKTSSDLQKDEKRSVGMPTVHKKWVDEMNYGKRWRGMGPKSNLVARLHQLNALQALLPFSKRSVPSVAAHTIHKRWIDHLNFEGKRQESNYEDEDEEDDVSEPITAAKRLYLNPMDMCMKVCRVNNIQQEEEIKENTCLFKCFFGERL